MHWEYVLGDDCYQPDEYLDEEFENTEYPGYLVSDHGRVYSCKTNSFLKERKNDRKGHKGFSIRGREKQEYPYLHRMMAEAFIPNPNHKPIVRHLDDDVDNNELDNLAWGTQYDNIHDSMNNKTFRYFTDEDREKSYRKSRRPIEANNGEDRITFKSVNEASRELGVVQANICKVLKGERSLAGGWNFKYLEVRDE